MTVGRTVQDQSISMNDDNGQMINKTGDDDDDNDEDENNHNDNSKRTSSNSNVFSRLMQSEPHVSRQKKNERPMLDYLFYPIAAIAANALISFIIILKIWHIDKEKDKWNMYLFYLDFDETEPPPTKSRMK